VDIPQIIIEIETEAESLKLVEKKLTMIREQIQEVADAKRLFLMQYGTPSLIQPSATSLSFLASSRRSSVLMTNQPKV
jgi:hypothetical protein